MWWEWFRTLRGRNMKRYALVLYLLFLSLLSQKSICLADWILEKERLHISVHRDLSCKDCHEDIYGLETHPNPLKKDIKESGRRSCILCHEDIWEDAKRSVHVREEGGIPQTDCIRCHNPHLQLSKEYSYLMEKKDLYGYCNLCHEKRNTLPPLSDEVGRCATCHLVSIRENRAKSLNKLCLVCHGRSESRASNLTSKMLPLIDKTQYTNTPHAHISCITCHQGYDSYPHSQTEPKSCISCHKRHHEAISHDLHYQVECLACHIQKATISKRHNAKGIVYEIVREYDLSNDLWIHNIQREVDCTKCHFKGNGLGISSIALPPKGVQCMPCHASTFTRGDNLSFLGLMVSIVLSIILVASWSYMRGSGIPIKRNRYESALRSILNLFKVIVLDILFQLRFLKGERIRWIIHILIFWSFLIRSIWGIVALFGSLYLPESPWVWKLLNRDDPITSFVFDLTGLMLLSGLSISMLRPKGERGKSSLNLWDRVCSFSLMGTVILGFVLESSRISMQGVISSYSFFGNILSYAISGYNLTSAYPYIWYIHSICWAVFLISLPFSRILHMVLSPLVLIVERDRIYK